MAESATYRIFKRRIGQVVRRVQAGAGVQPGPLGSEIVEIVDELRRAAEDEPEVALELTISLFETLPPRFHLVDDKLGLLGRALDQAAPVIVDILDDELENPLSVVDRHEVFERLFCLWVGDETGYLTTLDDTLAECVTNREDGDLIIEICRDHLRHLPLVFPASAGKKLDLDRAILQADRHRVERLLGEIYAGRGRCEYSVVVARGHYRVTGDAVDLLRSLARSGELDEAIEIGRRVLRRPDSPRHGTLKGIYEELVEKRDGAHRSIVELERAFLDAPDFPRFAALKNAVPPTDWPRFATKVLGHLQSARREPALLFRLFLGEGMIVDADGLVVTQPIDAMILAEAAHAHLEVYPQIASGWLVVAAHRILEGARREHYETAAIWMQTVRRVAELCDQRESFARALESFRSTYRRRPALLRALERVGL